MAKIIIHEVKMVGEDCKKTGRRLYVDRSCPLHEIQGWYNALKSGNLYLMKLDFDQAVKLTDQQDKPASKEDFAAELQSIA